MPKKWKNRPSDTMETYGTWANMKYRCHNPKHPQYDRYGQRGIFVCDKWLHDYDAFYEDMGPRPLGMSIERVDNNKGYSPENCIWATPAQQSRNTHRNAEVVFKDLASENNINYSTLMHRKRVNTDLTAPVREYRKGNEHGTVSRYVRFKCRCDICRKFYNQYQKEKRNIRLRKKMEYDL